MAFLTDDSGSFAFVKMLKELMGGGGGDSDLTAKVQTLGQFVANQWFPTSLQSTVPSNLSWLTIGGIPVYVPGREMMSSSISNRMLRSAMFMMSNTASTAKALSALTVFATGLEKLNAGQTYACLIIKPDGSIAENTIKAASAASLAFTADQDFPANSTLYVIIEEV